VPGALSIGIRMAIASLQVGKDLAFVVIASASLVACERSGLDATARCSGQTSAAIWGADPDSGRIVALSAAQQAAIGAVQSSPESVVCSATLVAPRWVLTAAHCRRSERLWFRTSRGGKDVAVTVVRTLLHSDRDVALMELEADSQLISLGIRPIAVHAESLGEDWVGRDVTLAGFGQTENGNSGERRFVTERIASISREQVVVDGQGVSGACHGDSGGPLLAHDPVEVIGVLSTGSASCVGVDRYERSDTLEAWIRATIEQAGIDPCGGLDWEGSCRDGHPMWCGGDLIVSEDCRGEQSCGYDVRAGGYRCLDAELDPCQGVGRLPECSDDVVVRCDAGELVRQDCASCGQRCELGAEGARCR
jgi:hypothetical protein